MKKLVKTVTLLALVAMTMMGTTYAASFTDRYINGTDNLKVWMLVYNRVWVIEDQSYKAKNIALSSWFNGFLDKTYNTSFNFFY